MDTNFLSIYENKIKNWEDLIENDPINSVMHQKEMTDYMLKCVPYIKEYTKKEENVQKNTIDNIFNSKTKKVGLQKKKILNDYLENVENKSVKREKRNKNEEYSCTECGSSNTYIDDERAEQICMQCGLSKNIILEGILSFKEEQEHEKVFNYFYKRENHFNEWLNQFQARETTNIPEDVIDQIRSEFKKNRIKNLDEITHAKVKAILKKLKHNKYYEHVPYITNLLNGIRPPTMTQELEDKLRLMFNEIQSPFDKHCPSERKNFLSYSYVLYKFCELLSEDDYLKCFPLLKSKEKLYQQDVIWKKICTELQWEFIPTI